jgi:hypothetical protein
LKNSLSEIAPKNRRATIRYKRFSPNADTFLVIRFEPVFRKTEFFNSYGCYRQLSQWNGPFASATSTSIASCRFALL